MKTSKVPSFYVLERIIYDSLNRNYSKTWNQLLIRPSFDSPDKYRRLLKGDGTGEIIFEGAVLFQNNDETEDEFLLRAACLGINVSFVIDYVRAENWNQYTVKVSDEEKDEEYKLPLPKKVVKTDKNLEKWA